MKRYIAIVAMLLMAWVMTGCDDKTSILKKRIPPIDYNTTTWLEIKGYKSPGYNVYMNVAYGGEGKECKYFSWGLGADVSRSTDMTFDANISKDDLHYTLRYPLNFKQGKCEFWAGYIEIGMEEYNDLDDKKYPKQSAIRISKIFDNKVLVMNLYYQKRDFEDKNFNLDPINVYCQRYMFYSDIYADDTDEKVPVFGAFCHTPKSYEGLTGLIGARYEVEFLKKHNPLTANLLISEDLKCSKNCSDEEMQRAKALGVSERMYRGSIYDKPTTNPLNTRFIPSIKLFEAFKEKHHIKEQ